MPTVPELIRTLQADLERVYPKAPAAEAERLRVRLQALQADLERPPAPTPGQYTPVGSLRMYTHLKEILLLYKAIVVPLLMELEKQRLETVAHMAQAWGPR